MKKVKFGQRKIPSLKGVLREGFMVFTDTETRTEELDLGELHLFKMGWVLTWDAHNRQDMKLVTERFFTDVLEYNGYLNNLAVKHKKITIYGHNIFFDLQAAGFFKYFTEWGWQLEWIYDRGLTYLLRIRKDSSEIMIVSTTNYYVCSLAKLGELIGVSKMDIDFKASSDEELKVYCYRDTEIVLRAMWYYLNFLKDNGLGKLAPTKASQAFIAYRTRFMHEAIYIHNSDEAHELERAGYYGGRVEAFRIGEVKGDEFVTLDINSMYPFVMCNYLYPRKLTGYIYDEPYGKYIELLDSWAMIAEVELDTPEPAFALRYNKKLIFPVGRFRTVLCSEGLKYALSKGYVKAFYRAAVYEQADLFSEYVNAFKGLKDNYATEENKVMMKLCKDMLTSLYGKFGQQEIITTIIDNDTDEDYVRRDIWDPIENKWWTETYLMNKIISQEPGGEAIYAMPAIAAHITENARMLHWSIIKNIGRENVLYCDTDCVIIETKNIGKVTWKMDEMELGALKVEKRFNRLVIGGAKNYRTDAERHIKGIPAKAREIEPGFFKYDSFARQLACLRAGNNEGVAVKEVTRMLKRKYDKGLVDKDGKVTPYRFPLP
jgi:hypothetical protein